MIIRNRSALTAALGAVVAAILLAAPGTASAQLQASGPEQRYTPGGAVECLDCHDERGTLPILRKKHALRADSRTPFAQHDCEGCHGPSGDHSKKPRKFKTALEFGSNVETPVEEQNAVCLGCHESGSRMNWRGSAHHFADVSCASCHKVHELDDPVMVKTEQADTCYQCHPEQRAENLRVSRHPIKEGKVICGDCHAPHGSFGGKQLKKPTVTETCYQCHQDKRGPFLWEHPPAREDCTLCHSPHGSTQPRMLKVRTPWLCQECHLAPFHPSTAYSGAITPPGGHQLYLQGCVNCHSQVHGSNHPSGIRFMR
jgi:DmsE family decaheme c-type cytochrome